MPPKEKLEIVIGAAKPRFAGGFPRRRRRRNAFGLIQEYCREIRARSLVGRAPPWHGGGQEFKSPRVHHAKRDLPLQKIA